MRYERLKDLLVRILCRVMVIALAGPALGQKIFMTASPLYDGLQPGQGVTPVEVDLVNLGPDARGVVNVSVGSFNTNYPVELPQGARKRLITYPDCGDYVYGGQIQFQLITNRGRVK